MTTPPVPGTAPEIIVEVDAEAAADVAAERLVNLLGQAIADRGRADWATTGGSTPVAIYRRLASPPLRDALDWTLIHVWWGDDRFVPHDHPLSNVIAVDEVLIGLAALAGESGFGETAVDVTTRREPGAPIPAGNVHPFPTSAAIGSARGPEWCAEVYRATLEAAAVPTRDGWPSFDLLMLGIGPDGHLLSVFPGSDAFDSDEWALAIPAPTHVEPHLPRVTLNPSVVTAADAVLVLVNGEGKAEVVHRALRGDESPRDLPARLAARPGACWILDAPAAALLEPR
jgi:6-phosphogluconolactonase